jgi:hydrogenase maturation protein HypF
METPQARDFFHESISLMKKITDCSPGIVACDLHPGYYSTSVASSMQNVEVVKVQHHHAHIASCMAENGIRGKVIGLAMDGTGFGSDGTVWGGEFLVADEIDFVRTGHIKPFTLPGGEIAIREPWRIGASLLQENFGDAWLDSAEKLSLASLKQLRIIETVLASQINCPVTSSLGRLFDGVAALLGIRIKAAFEGQVAMELEAAADGTNKSILPFSIINQTTALQLDLVPAIRELVEQMLQGASPPALAGAFHNTLIRSFVDMACRLREHTGLNRTVLSGGCFQNRLLLEGCTARLREADFKVYSHHLAPTNDGGISLGQAIVAASRKAAVMR